MSPRLPSRGRSASVLALATMVGASFMTAAWAASVTPVFYEGPTNRSCGSFNETWIELKIEGWVAGSATGGNLTVTVSNSTDDQFDWTSNVGVDAVYVKGGSSGSNLYVYDPASLADDRVRDSGTATTTAR